MKTLPLIPPTTPFERSVQTAFQLVQVPDVGATRSRPTINLLVGQTYFDTTLGKPVWWQGSQWVDATGVSV